jgi:hypothetical protein
MAQAVPNASPGSLLLSQDAPYSQYLRALRDDGWDDYGLERLLKSARDILESVRARSISRRPLTSNSRFAAIVDILFERGAAFVVAQLDKAQIHGEHVGAINSGAVDGFLNRLRAFEANAHTRIIILQDSVGSMYEEDWRIERLFNSHLLGIELDLSPAYVCHLLQCDNHRPSHVRRYPSFVFEHSGLVALYLGRKNFGGASPFTSEWI